MAMSDPYAADDGNPYAPPREIEVEPVMAGPGIHYDYGLIFLLFAAAPVCLTCLLGVVLFLIATVLVGFAELDTRQIESKIQFAGWFVFVIAYVGMILRKEWAFRLTAAITAVWAFQIAWHINTEISQPHGLGRPIQLLHLEVFQATYLAIICSFSFLYALACRRKRK